MSTEIEERSRLIDPRAIRITKPIQDSQTNSAQQQIVPDLHKEPPPPRKRPKALDLDTFPHRRWPGTTQLPGTIENVDHLLQAYSVTVRYDVIRKRLQIRYPGHQGSSDNADSVAMTLIESLAALNCLPISCVARCVEVLGDRHQYNPIADWITSKPWDGVDRLGAIYATLEIREGYPKHLKEIVIYRWLLSAVAAALKPYGFKARGVLTLQGPQSIGKTSWIASLVPDDGLREFAVKLGLHLDAGNKDTILTAISAWIVEIGELDSSFKKDVSRLKGFLTNDRDRLRKPYGRGDSEYQRRTVFAASVNEEDFLIDSSGNTRFWTIAVVRINYDHGIDTQQLFAQLALDFQKGERWWLNSHEEALLESHNQNHRKTGYIHERLLARLDLDRVGQEDIPLMTATAVLTALAILQPTNLQFKECHTALREILGEPTRSKGLTRWRVPLKKTQDKFSEVLPEPEDGIY
ncbi:MAG: VapE family protein [Rhodocyclaceae bacterium]|jgi:putative DNA primase/helicase|nr:VapE family protein [Rhodocyclaceae bacterium]